LLRVVLTLREDYVATLDPYSQFLADKLHARFYMKQMGHEAALEAITRPAAKMDRPFAPNVAEQLVENLSQFRTYGQDRVKLGEFVEPVQLQVVCYQLWEKLKNRPPGEITQKDVQILANVDTALAQFYEEAIATVMEKTGVSEEFLRDWIQSKLITEEGTRGTVYCGSDETEGLDNEAVTLLENQFILRAEIRAGGRWYELVHDRFIGPISQSNQTWSKQYLLQHDPLKYTAQYWSDSNRDPTILYSGERLREALASVDLEDQEPLVRKFLTASKEAEQERVLAEAQQESKRQKRNILILTLALLAALVLASSVGYLWSVTREARDEAETERAKAEGARKVALDQRATAQFEAKRATNAEGTAQAEVTLARRAEATALAAKETAAMGEETAAMGATLAAQALAELEANLEAQLIIATASPTPTPTPTPTATATPTGPIQATAESVATPTASPTPTADLGATATAEAVLTVQSQLAQVNATQTAAARSAVAVAVATPTVSPPPTADLSATATAKALQTVQFNATQTATATPTNVVIGRCPPKCKYPSTPVLIRPNDGESINRFSEFAWRWSDEFPLETYEGFNFRVFKESGDAVIAIRFDKKSLTLIERGDVLLCNQIYHWSVQVASYDGDQFWGNRSPESERRSFIWRCS
jgi:hypothetical protein